MNVAEIQTDLIRLIVQTNDSEFLQQMLVYFKSYNKDEDWWDNISDHEKESIEEGAKELEESKGIPYEEVRKSINERFKKN